MKKLALIIMILGVLIGASLTGVSAETMKAGNGYNPRGPISIYSNDQFTQENGVTGGSGTQNDPYIIEGWQTPKITIEDTDMHFVIRNCYVDGDWAIFMTNVENGEITNCLVENNGYWGIFLTNCVNLDVKDTTINKCDWSIDLEGCSDCEISDCTITKSNWAISLENSYDNTVHNNLVKKASYGLMLDFEECQNNLVHHNDFVEVYGYPATAHDSGVNQLDDGQEGNYWSHLQGTDEDGNGILDSEYVINNKNKDRYPLTYAIHQLAPTKPSISGSTHGVIDAELTYTIRSRDYNGDKITYSINWGDSTETVEDVESEEPVELTHTWTTEGNYVIKVTATDENGLESNEASLEILIEKTKSKTITPLGQLIQTLLAKFPNLVKLATLL